MRKVACLNLDSERVAIRLAGDLTKNPIASSRIGQNQRRPQFGCGKIGKGEVNYDNLPGCKCAHAASSSGLFQSSANAASLKSAPSRAGGSSSRMVTSARLGDRTRTGSTNRTSPLGSMMASTVLISTKSLTQRGPSATRNDSCPYAADEDASESSS